MSGGAQQPPVVVLAGFMGTGKTDVGREAARLLGVEFIDTDARIEAHAGKTIAEIFADDGEAAFRVMERKVCLELAAEVSAGAVIALGGGALMDPTNLAHIRMLGPIILLEAAPDDIRARIGEGEGRPLAGDSATLETRFAERRDGYARAPLRIDTRGADTDAVARRVVDLAAVCAGALHLDVDSLPLPPADPANPMSAPRRAGSLVVAGRGVAAHTGALVRTAGLGSRACVLVPRALRRMVLPPVANSLDVASLPHDVIEIEDGDAHKTVAQATALLDRLVETGAGRDTIVITVGGGVPGDIGGFVAAIYMRGLPFVQVPTTLLAQVDASIGGKVGVNHPRAKNLVGAFHQPHLVVADPALLETLPDAEVAGGMAEVVKTAIIGAPALFDTLREASKTAGPITAGPTVARRDPQLLETCVRACARVKGRIVEADPYETGLRRVLNLGHTLGHALEAATGYDAISHGEAVALGMLAAIRVGMARGQTAPSLHTDTAKILRWAGLPTTMPEVDPEKVRDALGLDKKRRRGTLRFVLPRDVGDVVVVDDVTDDELLSNLNA